MENKIMNIIHARTIPEITINIGINTFKIETVEKCRLAA